MSTLQHQAQAATAPSQRYARDLAIAVGIVLAKRPPDGVLVVDELLLERGHEELVVRDAAVAIGIDVGDDGAGVLGVGDAGLGQRGLQLLVRDKAWSGAGWGGLDSSSFRARCCNTPPSNTAPSPPLNGPELSVSIF